MSKKQALLAVIALIILCGIAGAYLLQAKHVSLARECPDDWIENRMPALEGDDTEKQYFVFHGERKEIKDYDVNWVKSNCSVKVQYIY